MLNIPTDLLRTLTTVVDLSSFTKAAKALGVTQPAVSAQIKRLQSLLGYDLLDKRAPGVILTPRGEFVVNQARKLLSINDDILRSTSGGRVSKTLRVALPESPTPRQRLLAAWKSVQRNPGRRLVADRIRAIAREHTLSSYEEAHGEVVEHYGARPRSLSRAGVVV